MGADEAIGLLIVGSLASSLGVSMGTAQLGENPERDDVGAGFGGQVVVALGLLWLATVFAEVRGGALSENPAGPRALFAPVAV